jgi:hypothetical protein
VGEPNEETPRQKLYKGADMKLSNKAKATLETLLVIGLILIIPLFFVMKTAAEQNAATNTSVSVESAIANAPAVISVINRNIKFIAADKRSAI